MPRPGLSDRIAQASFVAGEFSPLLASRSDIALYRNGAALARNRRPRAQGANTTRPGTRHLQTITVASPRLIGFTFSPTQRNALVFSAGRVDPYLPDGTPGTAVTGAPWTAAMLPRLHAVTVGDTVLLFHPDMAPQQLRRTGINSFALSAFAFEVDGQNRLLMPFEKYAPATITLTPSATTGSITITASAAAFDAQHVGTRIRLNKRQVQVTAFTSATQVTGTVIETLTNTTPAADWDEQAFGTLRGWPQAAAEIDNRLALGGSRSKPRGVWLSRIGAYFNFDLGTALDNEAIWESVTGELITEVRHLVAAERLLVLTDGGVWFVPTSANAPITPGNIAFRAVAGATGASYTRPMRLDGGVQYLDTTEGVMRELVWSDAVASYTADAISLAAEHLIVAPTATAAYDGSGAVPEKLGFARCADGSLAVFHSIRAEKIGAWYRWEPGGAGGQFLDVASIGADVLLLAQRTINGTPRVFLEAFDEAAAAIDASRRATSGSPARSFAGFGHLAGQLVAVVSREHDLGDVVVQPDGSITLPPERPAVTEIEAGLAYAWQVRPMPADYDAPGGPTRGLVKRLKRVFLQLDRSAAFSVSGRQILLSFQGDDFARPAPTVTGQVEVWLLGLDREAQCDLVATRPAKVTLLGITREVHANG